MGICLVRDFLGDEPRVLLVVVVGLQPVVEERMVLAVSSFPPLPPPFPPLQFASWPLPLPSSDSRLKLNMNPEPDISSLPFALCFGPWEGEQLNETCARMLAGIFLLSQHIFDRKTHD